MAQKTVEVTATNGSPTVTLSDTSGIIANQSYFKRSNEGVPGAHPEIYDVIAVVADTSVTLSANYAGTSDTFTGVFVNDFSANQGYPLLYTGDIDTPDILRRFVNKLDAEIAPLNSAVTFSTLTVNGVATVNGANLNLSNSYYLTGRNNADTLSLALIGRNTSDQVVIDPDGYGTLFEGKATVKADNAVLVLQADSATSPLFQEWRNSAGTRRAYTGFGGANDFFYINNETAAGEIILATSGTTAVTVKSDQRTRFSQRSDHANGIHIEGGQLLTTSPLAAGTYSNQILGAASAARDLLLVGQYGYSNGFTVQYNGTNMTYQFLDGVVKTPSGISFDGGTNVLQNFVGWNNFTPTIADASLADEGSTYLSRVGRYMRIGNTVHIYLRLTISALGTETGTDVMRIIGMPFAGAPGYYASFAVGYTSGINIASGGHGIVAYLNEGSSYITLGYRNASGNFIDLTINDFSSGDIIISGTYEI